MKSAADLIVSISLLFGAGYLSIKTIEKFEAMAKLKGRARPDMLKEIFEKNLA